jgi:hypothetical protein
VELTAGGYRVARFTHDDVVRRPAETIAALARLLSPPRATMSGACR